MRKILIIIGVVLSLASCSSSPRKVSSPSCHTYIVQTL
jgi:hypothetical protein